MDGEDFEAADYKYVYVSMYSSLSLSQTVNSREKLIDYAQMQLLFLRERNMVEKNEKSQRK